jgi:hypothetical protein
LARARSFSLIGIWFKRSYNETLAGRVVTGSMVVFFVQRTGCCGAQSHYSGRIGKVQSHFPMPGFERGDAM